VLPVVSPIEAIALRWVWIWLDQLWERGAVESPPFQDFCSEVFPLLEAIQRGDDRPAAIVALVDFLDGIDFCVFYPRGFP
jgi:hypothetical protein